MLFYNDVSNYADNICQEKFTNHINEARVNSDKWNWDILKYTNFYHIYTQSQLNLKQLYLVTIIKSEITLFLLKSFDKEKHNSTVKKCIQFCSLWKI